MENKELIYYGGQGYDYSNENGKFEVKAANSKTFTSLSKAIKYYESLNEEKALWDITSIPELLSCHTVR
jgi:hypothetical protein